MILSQLQTDVAVIKERLETFIKIHDSSVIQNAKKIEDHERRLRFLERYAAILIGAIVVINLVVSFIK